MKRVRVLLSLILVTLFTVTATGQSVESISSEASSDKTETFKVWGKCGMCKTRIEKTVKEAGVTEASWDQKRQMLTVTYDEKVTDRDLLSRKLADVGHDTEKYKAPDEIYEKLPACCHYEREE